MKISGFSGAASPSFPGKSGHLIPKSDIVKVSDGLPAKTRGSELSSVLTLKTSTFRQHNQFASEHAMHNIARTPIAALTFVALAASALTGCASSGMSGQSFPRSGSQAAWNVEYGEVVDVRTVEVEGEFSLLGILVGSAIGHAAGTEISDSRNAGTVGSVAGAVAGASIERAVTAMDGLQITVELDSGRTVAIVQDDEERFQDGERVRVLTAAVAPARAAVFGSPGIFGGPPGVGAVGPAVPVTRARVQRL